MRRLEEEREKLMKILESENGAKGTEERYTADGADLKVILSETLRQMKKYDKGNYDLKQIINNKKDIKNKFVNEIKKLNDEIELLKSEICLEQETQKILEEIIRGKRDIYKVQEVIKEEKKKYNQELEKIKGSNKYLNMTDEDVKEELNKKVEKEKERIDKELKNEKEKLELRFREKKLELETANESEIKLLRLKMEKELKKIRIDYMVEIENIKEENERLKLKEENARKDLKEAVKYLGFDKFINEEEMYFRNKIIAYNILVKVRDRNKIPFVYVMKEIDFAIIYRHVISTINLLIKERNENIDMSRKIYDLETKLKEKNIESQEI